MDIRQIEQYINGNSSEEQALQLWARLIADREYFRLLQAYIGVRAILIKKYLQ